MKRALVALAALALVGCKWLPRHKSVQDAGIDATVAVAPVDGGAATPDARAHMVGPNDLPQGNWEPSDGSRFGLTILPDGLIRFVTDVPSYRNGARVFGQITQAMGHDDDPNRFEVWVDVTKIYAKEIGPQHRRYADFELFEADILEQRVTSHNADAQKIPQLGGRGEEAPRGYSLRFGDGRQSLTLCTLATPPACRALVKKKSPSDLSRVRTNGLCKVDDDCTVVTNGEQCDPCLCPSQASLKTWPHKPKPDDTHEDLSWERTEEHLCGKDVPRRDDCPACPALRAVCRNKACVLRGG